MILNYDDFILESLLLESSLEFSDGFKKILELMPDDEIKNTLINSRSNGDFRLNQNYIDISDNKEEVSFIQDSRAKNILDTKQVVWKTNSSLPGSKFLTFNKDSNGEYNNKLIFEELSFEPIEPTSENHPVPGPNVKGKILSEYVSQKSGKTFVLFQWNSEGTDRFICLNKEALNEVDDTESMIYSSESRNNIRIGRLINGIMRSMGKTVTPSEVEKFTNLYKSAWEFHKNEFKGFDIISGYNIAMWYSGNRYADDTPSLGHSCMAGDECEEFFGIYTDNSDVVKLVILYADRDVTIKDGKFKSSLIKGRALLWKTNQGFMFMDRIYTNYDDDIELFKRFATSQGWWYKNTQNISTQFDARQGEKYKSQPSFSVNLKYAEFDYYPYVDTLCYLRVDIDGSGVVSNDGEMINAQYELRETEGMRDPY